jgi:2-oxoglutarate dehydrogenase E1 component
MLRAMRKPLVVMTPKSLLRHKHSTSAMADLAGGRFHNVIDEHDAIQPARVKRLILCSGKVYYDLIEQRRIEQLSDVAVVRIEQLYPFPVDEYQAVIERYANARDVVWCQEEPQNQGAWYQIRHHLQARLGPAHTLLYAGRQSAAAPATGIHALHVQEQRALVHAALNSSETEQTPRETHRLTASSTRKRS